jgi:hypothetical protein
LRGPRAYSLAYRASAALLAAADCLATLTLAAAMVKYLGPAAGAALSAIIALASLPVAYSLCRWLWSRAKLLDLVDSCCREATVHRAGREVCCRAEGAAWVCVDLVYSETRLVKVRWVEREVEITPLTPLNFSCASPIGGGRIVALSCSKANTLLVGEGVVEKVEGGYDVLERMLCHDYERQQFNHNFIILFNVGSIVLPATHTARHRGSRVERGYSLLWRRRYSLLSSSRLPG